MTGSIKLKSTSGGSVTIIAPTTASDYTLTLPTVSGNVVLADTNGGNVSFTGTVNAASLTVGSNFIANSSQLTIATPLSANGSTGTATYVLTSNGSVGSPYWAVAAAGTNAAAQYTWTNTHVFQNTVTFNGGGVLLANTVNATSYTVSSNFIANTTGAYHTGVINAASHTVGSSFIANTTGAYHTGVINAASHTTTGVTANVTGVYPASNSSGTALGTTTNRWVITANSLVLTTALALADGGTGSTTAAGARTNLGVTATGSDTTYAYRANNLSDLGSTATARTNLGLGTIATQASSSVSITGGSITGITDLAIADGGTGASTAAAARTNLGFTGAIVAWANMNGQSTPALNASGNISSITDNGTGDYTLNLTSATTDGNYALAFMSVAATATNATGATLVGLYPTGTTTYLAQTKTTTAVRFIVGDTNGTLRDSGNISIIFIR